jgi:hydroxymethylpyrimidine/phosphomethylpyrimidine kinase
MAAARAIPRVLSIAGSDSGGGAGIQADLKAFAHCGVYGMTAITAVTAQNTVGVDAVHAVPPEVVLAQVRAVVGDIGVDAVKVGMLGEVAIVEAVGAVLRELPDGVPIVVDPVVVSTTGARLLGLDALDALKTLVVPCATVLTPNLPEARLLAGRSAAETEDDEEPAALARALHELGASYVVLTGGHGAGGGRERVEDVFFDGTRLITIEGPRHPGGATHGSGCTHSAALAAQLALGAEPLAAARAAHEIAAEAVRAGLAGMGAGEGPVDVLGGRASAIAGLS